LRTVRLWSLWVVAISVLSQAWPAAARQPPARGSVTAVVTGVSDGDTCYLPIDGQSTAVRLAQIDAPEKNGQPYGRRAEQSLREPVWKKAVTATWRERDRYGRPVVIEEKKARGPLGPRAGSGESLETTSAATSWHVAITQR
jgi:endonuclease YncB( thermonuclease family)